MPEPIKIRRFDVSLPVPGYATAGSVGIDLAARQQTHLPPGVVTRVPLNVAIQLPEGYWGLLAARSSLHKRGLMVANGVGILDPDFSGNDDECQAILYNFSAEEVVIEPGERIVQLIVLPVVGFPVTAVTSLNKPNRGGIGSTGK